MTKVWLLKCLDKEDRDTECKEEATSLPKTNYIAKPKGLTTPKTKKSSISKPQKICYLALSFKTSKELYYFRYLYEFNL